MLFLISRRRSAVEALGIERGQVIDFQEDEPFKKQNIIT